MTLVKSAVVLLLEFPLWKLVDREHEMRLGCYVISEVSPVFKCTHLFNPGNSTVRLLHDGFVRYWQDFHARPYVDIWT